MDVLHVLAEQAMAGIVSGVIVGTAARAAINVRLEWLRSDVDEIKRFLFGSKKHGEEKTKQ